MWEIEDKEKKSLAENLSIGDRPGPSHLNTLGDCLVDVDIKQKYSELKRRVKEETVQAILKLNTKSPSTPKRSHQQNRSPPQQSSSSPQRQASRSPPKRTTRGGKSLKQKSPQKPNSDSKTFDILNQWFDEHSDKPYPTKKEKEELAKCCKMTVKQVSTWFNNKRYRSNCTLTKKGKGRGKGSK